MVRAKDGDQSSAAGPFALHWFPRLPTLVAMTLAHAGTRFVSGNVSTASGFCGAKRIAQESLAYEKRVYFSGPRVTNAIAGETRIVLVIKVAYLEWPLITSRLGPRR